MNLFPEPGTGFFFIEVDAQITFVKGDKGQGTHALLRQNKVVQQAKKIR